MYTNLYLGILNIYKTNYYDQGELENVRYKMSRQNIYGSI